MSFKKIDTSKIDLLTGNDEGMYWLEDNQVARTFSGTYTILEIETILDDMRAVLDILNGGIDLRKI